MLKKINYVIGDATEPIGTGNKFICHVCNDIGVWGGGFVLAISRKWNKPEIEYMNWFKNRPASLERLTLGKVQYVNVTPEICICNMIGQYGTDCSNGEVPVRYEAIEECLKQVAMQAIRYNATIHMPRIGCRLAGGRWEKVEALIEDTLCAEGIEVYVYDLKKQDDTSKQIDFVEEARINKDADETLKCILSKEYYNFDQYEEVSKIEDLKVAKLIIKRLLDQLN